MQLTYQTKKKISTIYGYYLYVAGFIAVPYTISDVVWNVLGFKTQLMTTLLPLFTLLSWIFAVEGNRSFMDVEKEEREYNFQKELTPDGRYILKILRNVATMNASDNEKEQKLLKEIAEWYKSKTNQDKSI
jgi:hypothetical protein